MYYIAYLFWYQKNTVYLGIFLQVFTFFAEYASVYIFRWVCDIYEFAEETYKTCSEKI